MTNIIYTTMPLHTQSRFYSNYKYYLIVVTILLMLWSIIILKSWFFLNLSLVGFDFIPVE